uniref:Variant surface glycoprotein 1125.5586 n=1 Tax=Trypanosoma brucei TaxID=5691 RepID=A0A1J0RCU4_9TRYP|nr:variant surface glycoprotein 1125.5586 [Trypanosoma brucei]
MLSKTVVVVLLLTLGAQHTAQGNKNALKADGFKKLCTLSGNLKTVTAYAIKNLQTNLQTRQSLVDLISQIRALRLPINGRLPPQADIVYMLVHARLRDATSRTQKISDAAVTAAATAALAAGTIDAPLLVFLQPTRSTDYCVANSNNNGKGAAADFPGCLTTEGQQLIDTTPKTTVTDIHADCKAIKTAAAASQNIVGQTNCRLTQTDNTNGGYITTAGGVATGVTWADGLLKFTTSAVSAPWQDCAAPASKHKQSTPQSRPDKSWSQTHKLTMLRQQYY